MSERRRLWMRFRRVDRRDREGYRDAVTAANVTAGSLGAHFWAFEADGGEGRFVEFLEGPEDGVLVQLHEATDASLCRCGDLNATDFGAGSARLHCTEFGQVRTG